MSETLICWQTFPMMLDRGRPIRCTLMKHHQGAHEAMVTNEGGPTQTRPFRWYGGTEL